MLLLLLYAALLLTFNFQLKVVADAGTVIPTTITVATVTVDDTILTTTTCNSTLTNSPVIPITSTVATVTVDDTISTTVTCNSTLTNSPGESQPAYQSPSGQSGVGSPANTLPQSPGIYSVVSSFSGTSITLTVQLVPVTSIETDLSGSPTTSIGLSTSVIEISISSVLSSNSQRILQSSQPVSVSASPTSVPAVSSEPSLPVSLVTSIGVNTQGVSFTTVIEVTPTLSRTILQPSSLEVSSFTTLETNSLGSVTSTAVIMATITPSSELPSDSLSSGVVSQPSSQLETFNITTTGVNPQGSSFTSVILITLTPSAPQVTITTSTGTDSLGNLFTTVLESTLPPSPVTAMTSTGTDSLGNPFTTIFSVSLEGFSFVITTTDYQGLTVPTTIIGQATVTELPGGGFPTFGGSGSAQFPCTPFPACIFTGTAAPTVTPAPVWSLGLAPVPAVTTPVTGACSPWPDCLIPPPVTNCSFSPFCGYPPITSTPTACDPFPNCFTDSAMPKSVQSVLSLYCNGTAILPCIFTASSESWSCVGPGPSPPFPSCLSTLLNKDDICYGLPFPDCLFTVYNPPVTATVTISPPGVTALFEKLVETTITTTTDSRTETSTSSSTSAAAGGLLSLIEHNAWNVDVVEGGVIILEVVLWNSRDREMSIIRKLPILWNTKWEIPGFPRLPHFHIPCIFFCHRGSLHIRLNPPIIDDLPPLPPPPGQNEPTPTESPSGPETQSTEGTTSTSSSSCTQATATSCTVYSTVSVSGSFTTQMTSTSCQTITSCSATGATTTTATSTTANATPTWRFIVPVFPDLNDTNGQQDYGLVNNFTLRLKAETNPDTLWVSSDSTNWTSFWIQNLSDSQVADYIKDPAVFAITLLPNGSYISNDTYTPVAPNVQSAFNLSWNQTTLADGVFERQPPPPSPPQPVQPYTQNQDTFVIPYDDNLRDDLFLVSQPPGVALTDISSYAYDTETRPVVVYVIDTGADLTTPAIAQLQRAGRILRWLYPGYPNGPNLPPGERYLYQPGVMTDYDPNGHGTKMLSKIAAVTDDLGPNLGVSRGASIVVVKLPEPIPLRTANGGVAVIQSTVTHAWNLIYDDVVAHGYLFGKAVISLSQGPLLNHAAELDEILMPELDQDDAAGMAYWDDYRIMRRLFDLGVTIVHASGNQGDPDEGRDANYELTDPMDLWGSQYNFPIIVVGAVDNAGVAWEGTQWVPPSPPNPFSGARVHVWAPGVDVLTNGPGSELEQVEGTSVSCAITAGLAAYFLGTPKHYSVITAIVTEILNMAPIRPSPGVAFVQAVRQYMESLAYSRCGSAEANRPLVIWNGEIPLNDQGAPVSRKRQLPIAPSCPVNLTVNTFYFITPNYTADISVLNAFTNTLKAETNASTLGISSTASGDFIGYWYQTLNQSQVNTYLSNPAVLGINADTGTQGFPALLRRHAQKPTGNEDILESRAYGDVLQQTTTEGATADMMVISQPPSTELSNIGSYAYPDEVTSTVRIYVVDSGANTSVPAYTTQFNGEPQWIWAGLPDGDNYSSFPYAYVYGVKNDWLSFDSAHGTCMMSKAVSQTLGISKKAALTIVRLPQTVPNAEELVTYSRTGEPVIGFRFGAIYDALVKIYDDLNPQGQVGQSQRKIIVNLSLNIPTTAATFPNNPPKYGDSFYGLFYIMLKLANQGVIFVTAAGNNGGPAFLNGSANPTPNPKQINTLPALFEAALPIIVAGSSDNLGNPTAWTQETGPIPPGFTTPIKADVYAPGDSILCALGGGDSDLQLYEGTSISAAQVSGMIATLIGTPNGIQQILNFAQAQGFADLDSTWAFNVRNYVVQQASYKRSGVTADPANVVYNGFIPLNNNGVPVCALPAANLKRQASEPACSTISAPTTALPSISVLPPSTTTSVAISVLPPSTSSVAPIGTPVSGSATCFKDQPVNYFVAEAVIQGFCNQTFTWPASNQPPNTNEVNENAAAISVTAPGTNFITTLNIYPDALNSSVAACSGGIWPRSVSIAECSAGFSQVLSTCSNSVGTLIWLTTDNKSCVQFYLDQSGLPEIPPPPPTTTAAPPAPTTPNHQFCDSEALAQSLNHVKFNGDEVQDYEFICRTTHTWSYGATPSNNGTTDIEPPNTTFTQQSTSGGIVTNIWLTDVGGTFNATSFPGTTLTCPGVYPRIFAAQDCLTLFSSLDQCQYGGTYVWETPTGCVQAYMWQHTVD